jgi:hypothetical protein
MNAVPQATARRGARLGLLAQHLESLSPEAVSARERLEAELGSELTRKLVFALSPRRSAKAA